MSKPTTHQRLAPLLVAGLLLSGIETWAAQEPEAAAPALSPYAQRWEKPSAPFIFHLGGLSAEEQTRLKTTPGVEEVVPEVNGRLRVVWQPYTWNPRRRLNPETDAIYDFLALKGRLGKTEWTHGSARESGCSAHVFLGMYRGRNFGIKFSDETTGHNEAMTIVCYAEPSPGQIEHEMLRFVAGTKVTVEQCGEAYVVLSESSAGIRVVWQISDQMYALIWNSFDREMVAAYVKRLGSIIPKDYQVSVDRWVENEIRWRLIQIDTINALTPPNHRSGTVLDSVNLQIFFPDLVRLRGRPDFRSVSPVERWEWLNWARNFLWANRCNFRYDETKDGYILKGQDLYDPAKPPELPEEIRGPPKPENQVPQAPPGDAPPAPAHE